MWDRIQAILLKQYWHQNDGGHCVVSQTGQKLEAKSAASEDLTLVCQDDYAV